MDEFTGPEINSEAEKNRRLRWNEWSQDPKCEYRVQALILDAVELHLGLRWWDRHGR